MRIFKYLLKYLPLLILAVAAGVFTVMFQLMIPVEIGKAIDSITKAGQINSRDLLLYCCYTIMEAGFAAATQWIMTLLINTVVYRASRNIRNKAFDHMQSLPVSYIDSHPAGDTISRITTDVEQFADGLLLGLSQFFTGIMMILGTVIFMIRINKAVAVAVILLTPLSLFVAAFISKKTHKYFTLQSERRGKLTSFVDEMIGGEKTVQSFGYEKRAEEKFDELNKSLSQSSFKATFYSSIVNPGTRFVNNIIYAVVAIAGAYLALRENITVGAVVTFLAYANQYMKPFNEISNVLAEIQNSIACGDRIMDMIESDTIPEDDEDADNLVEVMEGLAENERGHIDIENLCFSYDKEKPLIEDLNLKVSPGMRVAIVGPTGSGKSTMINLLMRFYDVDSGTIEIENRDVRHIKRGSLRESFGMVLQETWLKNASVRDNICYGAEDATDEEMINAARLTHADHFIRRLPDGYDTVLAEDGGTLSEGQMQLLCITRVMLRIPPMLILDEATSSIDTRTEHRVQRAFAKMMKGRTSFIVAHRLSTIREADMILVMKDGAIVEQGSHEELLMKNGFYSELYRSQFEEG